jgi:ketosteroid isomerase-like protein
MPSAHSLMLMVDGHFMFWRYGMTENKKTVEIFMDGFNKSDHKQILSCLTDDVEWVMPGVFHLVGNDAFGKEIEKANFTGKPVVTIIRIIEEKDVVVAEGKVVVEKTEGGYLDGVFCDVFIMENGKIKQLTSYLIDF